LRKVNTLEMDGTLYKKAAPFPRGPTNSYPIIGTTFFIPVVLLRVNY